MEDLSGQIIKGYEIGEWIGAGGFGAVYKARQSTVGREVAIKIILSGYANQPDFIRRFEAEAQLVARLEHPHIVPLYDYWRDPSGAYIVMRFLREGSLRDALCQEPFNLQSTAHLLDQITSALALAHRSDVIHRDLKPENILLDEDGNAYLADFGIAKVLGDLSGDLTQSSVIGSLDYISPEQARNEPVTPRTDIYSLGVVLYEVLTGQHPFPNASSVERLYKHINEPLPEIDTLEETSRQEQINAIIQKATAKNPAKRFGDVLGLAASFREAIGLTMSPRDESIVEALTLREQEVLRFIIEGFSNREIADKLVITLGTAKWYVNQIYRKLGVRSRVQAILQARELNLVLPVSMPAGPPSLEHSISTVSLPEPENPYRGLRPFQAADQRYFFGREQLVETLIQRLNEQGTEIIPRFLAVIGPSGSGKSSLVRAGLIPAFWRGNLTGSECWFIVDMLPGAHPLDELEIALLQVAADQAPNLREQLDQDVRGLLRVAKLILPKDDSELVVVVDQFEEVFTLLEDEVERVHFLDLLYTAVTDPHSRVRVIVTMRADFYDRPLHYPEFGELMRSRMETVLPLSAGELERAIRRPAEMVGLTFEDGLVATILDEVHYQPGALPLLQYALTELFDRRQNRVLTRKAYQEIGGTVGALATRAEDIYEHLSPEGQTLTQQMFLRLVTLGEGIEDTRRRVPYAEIIALTESTTDYSSSVDLMEDVIDTFANYRLLSLDNDPGTRTPTVEVAHEAILREWDRLSYWLDESRDDIREERILARSSREWLDSGGDASFLLRGSRLEYFASWAANTDLALTADERNFLEVGQIARQQREQEETERQAHEARLEKRSRRFLWALVGVFAVATVIAIILSGVAFNQSSIAQENAATATYAQGEALNLADSRATQQAIAEDEVAARATQQAIAEDETRQRATQQALAENEAKQRAAAEAVAQDNLLLARANELGNISLNLKEKQPDLAFLLSVEAYRQSGSLQNWTAMYDVGTYKPQLQRVLRGHLGRVQALVYSPDGKILASGGLDGTVLLWDMDSGSDMYGHSVELPRDSALPPIESVAFSPDGHLLAASTADGRVLAGSPHQINHVLIWDIDPTSPTYQQLLKHQVTEEFVYLKSGVAFHPFLPILAVARTGMIELLDADPISPKFGERLGAVGDSPYFGGVAFSPDGQILAAGACYIDPRIILWQFDPQIPSKSEEITTMSPFLFCGGSGIFSPDGKSLVNGFRRLRSIDLECGPEFPCFRRNFSYSNRSRMAAL